MGGRRDKRWLFFGLAILVVTPLIAIVILSVWWLEAERASLDARQIALAERTADELAREIDGALLDAVLPLHDALIDANRAGGAAAVRSLVASDPLIAFATLEGDGRHLDFPPPDGMLAFYEGWVLERAGILLADTRRWMEKNGEAVWRGSSSTEGPSVVSCRPAPPAGSVCIVLEGNALQTLARQVFEAELGDHPEGPAIVRAGGATVWRGSDADHRTARRTSLVEPFAAFAVSVPLIDPGIPALPRQALFALLILAILLAAAALLYWNHERQLSEARRRVEMLAEIAHELRTPLANLQLYGALLERQSNNADVARYCDVLEQECTRLSSLIENTLSLARAERRGGTAPKLGNPDAILRGVVERLQPSLDHHRSIVSTKLGVDRALCFDRLAYERILINLIDNACTHAPGTDIHIWTRVCEDRLEFGVEDGGPGIVKEKRRALFDAFETSRADGFGLGLATCHSLAEAAGGSIRYDDEARGAHFRVCLPISVSPEAAIETTSSLERPACAS